MDRADMSGRTTEVRKAAETAIYQAYECGYSDGMTAWKQKKERWTKAYDGIDRHVKCTGCFKTYDWASQAQYYNFCPNCGADMRGEKGMKPTEKQMNFIEDIQEWTGKQFKGTTKEEASKFIEENIEEYRLEMEVRSEKWGY